MRIATPKLDVRDLRLLIALVEGRTTARAGELLHLTQPSVSRALLDLESRVGTLLFERSARGLAPTPVTTRLVAEAADLLERFRRLEDVVDAIERPRT
ncbi:MAG: LysR family transcriptional regulator, partial [Myxococcota bacterium]